MNRRIFLKLVGGVPLAASLPLLSSGSAVAAPVNNVALVELINFGCNRCHTVNEFAETIKNAARDAGIPFRVAPIAWLNQSPWPDRVYYSVRDLYPNTEGLVRDALFDGIQREGQRFEDLPQVMAYLERRQLVERALKLDSKFNLATLAERAVSDEPLVSETKAVRLAALSAAQETPVFIWLQEGEISKVMSPADFDEPVQLAQGVIAALKSNKGAGGAK